MLIVAEVFVDFWLGVAAVFDHRHKKIPLLLPAAGAAAGCVVCLLWEDRGIWDMLAGLIPGCVMVLIAFLTGEKVGYGDGLMLLALGLLLPAEYCFMSSCAGLFLEAAAGLALLAVKKVSGKSRMPFLPFLLLGYVTVLGVYR